MVEQVVGPGSDFIAGEVAEHSNIGCENQYEIPPPGEFSLGKEDNRKAEHGGFFEFEKVFHKVLVE